MIKCILTEQFNSNSPGGGGGSFAPAAIDNITVKCASNGKIYLTWSDPEDLIVEGVTLMTWGGTKVVYKANSCPTSPTDGTVVVNNITKDAYSSNPLIIPNLTIGTTYYIKLFPYSNNNVINENEGENEVHTTVAKYTPTAITNLTVKTTSNQKVYLTWSDPSNTVVNGIIASDWLNTKLVYKSGSAPTSVTDGTVAATVTTQNQYSSTPLCINNLTNGTAYYFRAFPSNTDGYTTTTSTAKSATPNAVYLGNISNIGLAVDSTDGGGKLNISWTDPADISTSGIVTADWAGTKLVRKTGSYPTSVSDGVLVINSTTHNQYSSSGYVDSGLTNGTQYYYAFFPYTNENIITVNTANRTTGTPIDWTFSWATASWQKVHELCDFAKDGSKDINDYVAIGNTKQMTLSSAVLGASSMTWEVIDINKDLNGSITIQTKNTFPTTTTFDGSAQWTNSTARTRCQEIYNQSEAKAYIATVSKGTNTNYNTSSVAYTNETVFLPSIYEVGLSSYSYKPKGPEYTNGVNSAYAKYTNNSSRIKKAGNADSGSAAYWWTRSRNSGGTSVMCYINTDGSADYGVYDNSRSLAPAAVIG